MQHLIAKALKIFCFVQTSWLGMLLPAKYMNDLKTQVIKDRQFQLQMFFSVANVIAVIWREIIVNTSFQ